MTDLEINNQLKDLYNNIKESKDELKGAYIIASNIDNNIISAVLGTNKSIGILLSNILVDNPKLINEFKKAITVAKICIELTN